MSTIVKLWKYHTQGLTLESRISKLGLWIPPLVTTLLIDGPFQGEIPTSMWERLKLTVTLIYVRDPSLEGEWGIIVDTEISGSSVFHSVYIPRVLWSFSWCPLVWHFPLGNLPFEVFKTKWASPVLTKKSTDFHPPPSLVSAGASQELLGGLTEEPPGPVNPHPFGPSVFMGY